MEDSLLRYRGEFPILETTTYLISNSLGAMPRGVTDAMREYTEMWARRGVRAWADRWWMLAREVGDEIAELMDASAGSVSIYMNIRSWEDVLDCVLEFDGSRQTDFYTATACTW